LTAYIDVNVELDETMHQGRLPPFLTEHSGPDPAAPPDGGAERT